jgi:sterol desaturase/sphingolipid hydroxylase (fatty acid hydroxylase superfamily)
MNPMLSAAGSLIGEALDQSQWRTVLHSVYAFMLPQEQAHKSTLPLFALNSLTNVLHSVLWFLLLGVVVYAFSLRRSGKPGTGMFSYAHPIREPGERFSVRGALQYLLPASFYTHPSFKFDMLWWPLNTVLSFFGLLGVTLGPGIVQAWWVQRFGHSPLTLPDNGVTIALQVVLVLLARDLGRFLWHYQGHTVPFFWEFHKGHHSAEVLHPFGVRTHPVDMFIRNTYTGVGSGLIAGTLIYLLGLTYGRVEVSWVVLMLAIFLVGEIFEHTHVRVSFGRTLNRFFYAPYMHHFHHGAAPRHMNVNLGITGGLTLWDWMFGTLYWPEPGEKIVWGASMQELGSNNPHRTLKGFLWGSFVAAFRTLRPRKPVNPIAPAVIETP